MFIAHPLNPEKISRIIEEFMPTESPVAKPTDIDFRAWRDDDVEAIVWDMRGGRLGQKDQTNSTVIKDCNIVGDVGGGGLGEVSDAVENAISQGIGTHILLGDNFSRDSGVYARVMQEHGLTQSSLGSVTSSSRALRQAGRAGVSHRSWTRPQGDQSFHNPIDVFLRFYAHVNYPNQINSSHDSGDDGFVLRDGSATNPTATASRGKFDEFMYEHGRVVADTLTYSRLAIAMGVLAVNSSKIEDKKKRLVSTGLVSTAYLTDFLDGKASRRSKHGETASGAKSDQEIDKILSIAVDVAALLPQDLISVGELAAVLARDVSMTRLRAIASSAGMETKSVPSGKRATALKGVSQVVGLTLGKSSPALNRAFQVSTVALKLSSMVQSIDTWNKSVE